MLDLINPLADHDLLMGHNVTLTELTKRFDLQTTDVLAVRLLLGGGLWQKVGIWALSALWGFLTGWMLYLSSVQKSLEHELWQGKQEVALLNLRLKQVEGTKIGP